VTYFFARGETLSVKLRALAARSQPPRADEPFHILAFPNGAIWTQFYRADCGYLLRFPALADFEVSEDGRTVNVLPVPAASAGTIDHLYLNQVLPLALSRQGQLVLHGSAVEFAGNGVALIGASGRGKSTLAASFAINGSRFLTDDGLQLRWLDGHCWISPSHPSVRLWNDSEEALITHTVKTARDADHTAKVRLLAGEHIAFCAETQRLRCVYFLGEGVATTPTIKAVPPADALMELVKHSFLLDTEAQQTLAWHFEELVRLTAMPIYFRLDYPRRYEDLSEVRATIIRHVTDKTN
jgi:hypothetical protein